MFLTIVLGGFMKSLFVCLAAWLIGRFFIKPDFGAFGVILYVCIGLMLVFQVILASEDLFTRDGKRWHGLLRLLAIVAIFRVAFLHLPW